MRITCPFCGTRDAQEFSYLGDARPKRPGSEAAEPAFYDYVYLRENPAGPIEELWYHTAGCRAWVVVSRNTRTHEMLGARLAASSETADRDPSASGKSEGA